MIKKIIKKAFAFSMLLAVLFSYLASPFPVYAANDPKTLGDLKGQLAGLKKQKAENEAKQQYTESQIRAREKAISDAEAEIAQAERDIEEAERKIEESNVKIEEFKEATEKAMKATQQLKNQNAYLEYVANSASLTDLIMRISAMEQITNSYKKNLDALEALIKENEQLKIDLKQKEINLNKKIEEYQAKIEQLYGDLKEYDKFELDIDTQIKTLQSQVDAYVKLCAESSKSYLGDAELLTDCVNVPYNAGWLKPLNSGVVTSQWGYRTDPITGKKYSSHSGIDIGGNAEGTNVYAAAAGTVAGIVTRYRCGGNMVYINVTVGGKQYTTYYYHLLTINVKYGQVVTQNTVIGTVGGGSTATSRGGYDSCTTGAHLHYGVMTGYYTGSTPVARQINPPGFRNVKGYRFSSRTDYAE